MILESLAKHFALYIKKQDPNGEVSIAVMEYELGIRFNLYAAIIITILIGLYTDQMVNSLIAFAAFAISRRFSGGIHLKSLTVCSIVSALIFSVIPFVVLSHTITLTLTVISIIIFTIFSPNTTEDVNPSRLDLYLKIISISIVSTNLVIQSPIIALSFFVQALLLPWKGGVNHETINSPCNR